MTGAIGTVITSWDGFAGAICGIVVLVPVRLWIETKGRKK